MRWQGAIFDLDGTLLDSMEIWDQLGVRYLRGRGVAPRPELETVLMTATMTQAAEYFIKTYHFPETAEEIVDGINALLAAFYSQEVKAKPGVEAFLQSLRADGTALCVATATDRPQVEAGLAHAGLAPYFSRIFTCTEVGAGKERPDVFEAALAYLGTEKSRTLVVEDALHAVETAKRAGFPVACVLDASSRPVWETIKARSDYLLDDPKGLVKL